MAGNNLFDPKENLYGGSTPQTETSTPSTNNIGKAISGFADSMAKQKHNDDLASAEEAKANANTKPFVNPGSTPYDR